MPVDVADLPIIEAALYEGSKVVVLTDGSVLPVCIARRKANHGKGVRSVKGTVVGADVHFNTQDLERASDWAERAKSGQRVTWILVGKFPNRAAVPMVDGKLAKPILQLPGAPLLSPLSGALPSATWDEVLILHRALHSAASKVCVSDATLDINVKDDGERWLKLRGVKLRTQAPNNTAGGKIVAKTHSKMTWIECAGRWGQVIDDHLTKACSFVPDCTVSSGMCDSACSLSPPPAKKHKVDPLIKKPSAAVSVTVVSVAAVSAAEVSAAAVSAPKLLSDLSSAKAEFHDIDRDTEDFWVLEELLAAHLHGRNEDYNEKQIKSGKRPTTFVLVSAQRVDNSVLASRFQARRETMSSSSTHLMARERVGFHGTHPSQLSTLCDFGLLPFGHRLNPCKSPVDSGYFGSCSKGIYLSRYADYTLKYANRLLPLEPGERCKIILFKCSQERACT